MGWSHLRRHGHSSQESTGRGQGPGRQGSEPVSSGVEGLAETAGLLSLEGDGEGQCGRWTGLCTVSVMWTGAREGLVKWLS